MENFLFLLYITLDKNSVKIVITILKLIVIMTLKKVFILLNDCELEISSI